MKLLKQLYECYSPSGKEDAMMALIKAHCLKVGAKVIEDEGQLYAVKGTADTYPCVVAHTDQVQDAACKAFQAKDIMFGLSLDGRSFQGLGADDKNGIWIALKCLEAFSIIKVAFFRDEERGCLGSAKANIKFFEDCRFVVQCDRKGGHDFIYEIGTTEICSKAFMQAADLKTYGFKKCTGMMTDVQKLRNMGVKVSCCNISCGYYEPHTAREYTILPELKNTLAFVKNIIRNCTDVYPFEAPKPNYGYGTYGGYSAYNGNLFGSSAQGTNYRTLYDRVGDLEDGFELQTADIADLWVEIGELKKRVSGLERQALASKYSDLPKQEDIKIVPNNTDDLPTA